HRDDKKKYFYDSQRMHALSVLDKICVMSCDNLPVISFARVVPHIQNQSRLNEQILPRKSDMRDSPVSVSAPLRKLNAVCVLCDLKYFRGNIEISEYWAF